MATTEQTSPLSDIVRESASGRLPEWARVTERRREHIGRVAQLMRDWSIALDLSARDRTRWLAAAWLHDSLRDAGPEELRRIVPEEFKGLPGPLLHGPAAAELLAGDADPELQDAIRYHTVGHASLRMLGRALYLADFLEPGRDFSRAWRESLRGRMPDELGGVLVEVVASRIRHLLDRGKPIRPETASFWSSLVEEHS